MQNMCARCEIKNSMISKHTQVTIMYFYTENLVGFENIEWCFKVWGLNTLVRTHLKNTLFLSACEYIIWCVYVLCARGFWFCASLNTINFTWLHFAFYFNFIVGWLHFSHMLIPPSNIFDEKERKKPRI